MVVHRVPTAQGKQGKWPPKKSLSGNLEILSKHGKHRKFCQNTGNFVSSNCKCSDSKSKAYCRKKKIHFFPEAGYVCQVSFVYVIVTNYVNWHRENLRSDRENTGNLKIQFEWVPCVPYPSTGAPECSPLYRTPVVPMVAC